MTRTSGFARIFVENDALVFFNVPSPWGRPGDKYTLVDILREPEKFSKLKNGTGYAINLKADFSVQENSTSFFNTENYHGRIETASCITPCIVFCAFTRNQDKSIKSVGVYHASRPFSMYLEKEPFEERIKEIKCDFFSLIHNVKEHPSENKERVTVIGNGFADNDTKETKVIFDYVNELMRKKGLVMVKKNFVLGGDGRNVGYEIKDGELKMVKYNIISSKISFLKIERVSKVRYDMNF